MSGETKASVSGWTIDTLATHHDAIRSMQKELDSERDRRYTEVGVEREKALKIKETADLAALDLAREIQTYKDEKANELREQINSERGLYATKDDLVALGQKFEASHQPVLEFMAAMRGGTAGVNKDRNEIMRFLGLVIALITIGTFVFITMRTSAPAAAPQVIYVPAAPGTLVPSQQPAPTR